MKTQNTTWLILVIAFLCISFIISGCKNDDEPEPVQEKKVWAVGFADSTNYALIYFSADGGETWIRQGEGQAALKDIDIMDVWAVDENTVWAVAVQNVILKTTDGGKNWLRVTPPSNSSGISLSSISMIGNDNIWISGTVVYHSIDGGNSWTTIQSPVLINKGLQGIHAINKDIIYAAGGKTMTEDGFIARTIDGGQTWDSIVPANNYNKNRWIGVTSSDPNNIIVYGGTSHYVYSNDGGQSWKNDSTHALGGNGFGGADFNDLVMLDNQTWWCALDNDNIGLTNNAASSTWINQGPAPGPQGYFLLGIDYYNKNLCVIVGENTNFPRAGKIIQTSNAGQFWELKVNTNAEMQKVSFIK